MAPASVPSSRLPSLDGLRGIAALIVVLHHLSLLYPPIAAVYVAGSATQVPQPGSVSWWLLHSPLKLLTAGPEAVLVFFVLSGFVLALPLMKEKPFDWMAYYPRRLVRIGLPVVCSLLFAAALALLVPQNPADAKSVWITSTSVWPLTVERLIANLDPTSLDNALNNPLWSIYWEMAFSMMLPLFVGVAVALRRWWPLALLLAAASVFLGADAAAGGFIYLPAFFVGTLAAAGLPAIRAVSERIRVMRFGWAIGLAVLVACALLLIGRWLIPDPDALTRTVISALQPIAALGIVLCSLEWRPLAALLTIRPIRWMGTVSFSLYLVHAPIIVTLSYALPGAPLPVVVIVALVAAFVAAPLFYWLVEKRAHGVSRWFGARIAHAYELRAAPAERVSAAKVAD